AEGKRTRHRAGNAEAQVRHQDRSPDAAAFRLELDVGVRLVGPDQLDLRRLHARLGDQRRRRITRRDTGAEDRRELAVGYFAGEWIVGHGAGSRWPAPIIPDPVSFA